MSTIERKRFICDAGNLNFEITELLNRESTVLSVVTALQKLEVMRAVVYDGENTPENLSIRALWEALGELVNVQYTAIDDLRDRAAAWAKLSPVKELSPLKEERVDV